MTSKKKGNGAKDIDIAKLKVKLRKDKPSKEYVEAVKAVNKIFYQRDKKGLPVP